MWEIPPSSGSAGWRGGFHIWPEGMPDPSQPQLSEEADLPVTVLTEDLEPSEPLAVPAGTEAISPGK